MNKSKVRHLEKEAIFLRWLLFFDYTNRKITAQLLGVTDGSLTPFYRSLKRKNYIETITDPLAISGNKIILLTRDGFDRAMTINLDIKSLSHKKSVPATLVRHQLKLQEYLVGIGVKSEYVVSDKVLRKKYNNVIVPDAIALIDNKRVAVEMELTRKKPAQIYYKFEQQISAMKAGGFSKVIWIFDDERLKKYYEGLFLKSRWPLCNLIKSRVVVQYSEDTEFAYLCGEADRELFCFEVINGAN